MLVVALLALWWIYRYYETRSESSTTFVMDTVMQQNVYGPRAKEAIQQVTDRIASMESELSLYEETSDIARLKDVYKRQVESIPGFGLQNCCCSVRIS